MQDKIDQNEQDVKKPVIPVSAFFNRPLGEVWDQIASFHFLQGSRILDPTCGEKFLWKGIDTSKWEISFSDILQGQDLFDLPKIEANLEAFDGVIYDPPYFFGTDQSSDPREKLYGGYSQSWEDLHRYMEACISVFPRLLVESGKLIVKCADMFSVPYRRFYPLHLYWCDHIREAFDIVDFFIYKHSRVSPTAWQVKNRASSVVVHTYFIVARLKG